MPTELTSSLEIRDSLIDKYPDVLTADVRSALELLAPFDVQRRALMEARIARRARRSNEHEPIAFLDPDTIVPGTSIRVQDAREGRFDGSDIPSDLRRQWIQGTGPGARPHVAAERSIRNVAYALLSGADGWMFDGED